MSENNISKTEQIIDEFRILSDNILYDEFLLSNIFELLKKYVPYDIAGVYFCNSDELARNVFSLALPNKNISLSLTDIVRDKFFDEMEKHKRINEIECALVTGDISENEDILFDDFKSFFALPFKYAEKLSGGFCFATVKELNDEEKENLQTIVKELYYLCKIKYLFSEQARYSLIDAMTGIYNRQEFDAAFELEFYKASRYIYNFSIAMLDIDHLGEINEKYGNDFGDFVITELAGLLKRVFRKTDPLYRFSSEKIAILLPFTPITKALIPIERLRKSISEYTFEKDGKQANVTVSVGLSANYSKFNIPSELIEGVNIAVARAKERGRNKVDIFE